MHHAHDGGDDAECRQGIGHFLDRVDRNPRLLVMGFYLVVHQVLDLERIQVAADHEAQVVGQEFHHMVIGGDLRILGEYGALVRSVDVGLDRHQSFLAHLGEDVIEQ